MAKSKQKYKTGERVVYPRHGVGEIVGTETIPVDGGEMDLMLIKFDNDKMLLRLPLSQLPASGLRPVATQDKMDSALHTLSGKSRNRKTMWARRAQEYEGKINSGDPVAIAEVLRDLFRKEEQQEQSYSERQLYQSALERLATELAVVERTDRTEAVKKVEELLDEKPAA